MVIFLPSSWCVQANALRSSSWIHPSRKTRSLLGSTSRQLVKASSGGLQEGLDHILGDSLKLLENLASILNKYRAKYLNSYKATFSKLQVFGIQCIKKTITLISVSTSGDNKFLYQTPRTSQIPTTFDERHHLLSLFEFLAYLFDAFQKQDEIEAQLQEEHAGFIDVPKDQLLMNTPLH